MTVFLKKTCPPFSIETRNMDQRMLILNNEGYKFCTLNDGAHVMITADYSYVRSFECYQLISFLPFMILSRPFLTSSKRNCKQLVPEVKDNLREMAARKFFAELFGSKSQVQVTTEVNDEKRRVSISNSGRFRQRNKRRKELQKDTFSPHNPIAIDCSREIESSLQQQSENVQKINETR